MKRGIITLLVVAGIAAGAYYYLRNDGAEASANAAAGQPAGGGGRGRQGGGGGGGFGGGGFGGPGGGFGGGGGGPRLPMTVELGQVSRADLAEELTVVGNLIGAATVEAVPKVSGRLENVNVRLGDRVNRGQRLAKVEDRELLEQIKQAEASYAVSQATIRQREADLRLANTNLERTRNLYEKQLIPKQTYDDVEARYQAAQAQLDLSRAQFTQSEARLDELKINLSNTIITSPVSGFVGKRALDPGAWITPNSSFISLVDISTVRLVANVIEKDLRRVTQGLKADVSVDAFPGEHFEGRIARVAPILDPLTRTAQIEVEINNSQFRLKPGMYATVGFTVEQRQNALVVPTNSIVDSGGRKGVFMPDKDKGETAKFQPVKIGMIDDALTEVVDGLAEGTKVVTTGAAALREGDRIILLGANANGGREGGQGGGGGERGGRGQGRGGRRGGSPSGGQ